MHKVLIDGEIVTMTNAEFGALPIQPEIPPKVSPLVPALFAMAELTVVDGEIYGLEQATGIGFAMMLEPGIFWVFFTEAQPDPAYIAFVQCPGHCVDVTAREIDHIELAVTDRATAEPVIPASIAITVQRVK